MRVISSMFVLLLLAGCTFEQSVRSDIDDQVAALEATTAAARGGPDEAVMFRRLDYPWLGDEATPYARDPANETPASLTQTIEIDSAIDVTLAVLAGFLQEASGVPVDLAPDVRTAAQGVKPVADTPLMIARAGTVQNYLDFATAQTETHWQYHNGRIAISRFETRSFPLPTLAVESGLSASITNATVAGGQQQGGAGPSGQGGANAAGGANIDASNIRTTADTQQTSTTQTTLDPYRDLEALLKAMQSSEGTVAVSRALATITVRDTPARVRAIERFLDDVTQRMTRFVGIDVTIASLELNDSNATGIDWSLLRAGAGDFYGVGLAGGGSADPGAVRAGITVIDPRSPYADSTLLIDALRKQGRVHIQRQTTLTTMNNQVATIQKAQDRGGGRTDTQVVVPDAGIVTTSTISRLTTGISLDVLPLIMEDNRIQMHIQGTLSKRDGDDVFGTGANALTAPIVSKAAFQQRAIIASGSTLALTSIDESTTATNDSGVGSPRFTLLGGKRQAERSRQLTLILVKPRVLQ